MDIPSNQGKMDLDKAFEWWTKEKYLGGMIVEADTKDTHITVTNIINNLFHERESLHSSLSAAEKERQELKEEVDLAKESANALRDKGQEVARTLAQRTQERDTALRELAEARESLNRERQLSDVKCANLAEIGYQNFQSAGAAISALAEVLTSIRTALGCPDLPVEELAGKVGEVVASRDWWEDNSRQFTAETRVQVEQLKAIVDALVSRGKEVQP